MPTSSSGATAGRPGLTGELSTGAYFGECERAKNVILLLDLSEYGILNYMLELR